MDVLERFAVGAPLRPPDERPTVRNTAGLARAQRLRTLADAHEATRRALQAVRVCVREHCGEQFREAENIGQWRCTWHVGRYDDFAERWRCCGAPLRARACRRADHVAGEEWPRGVWVAVEVPRFLQPFCTAALQSSLLAPGEAHHWRIDDLRAPEDMPASPEDEREYHAYVGTSGCRVKRVELL